MASSMMDIYANQIARARELQFPTGGGRPINSGIVTGSTKPGYEDEFKAAGAALSEIFLKPRAQAYINKYRMENDPAVLEDRMGKALEWNSKMPDDIYEQIRTTPGHQELLRKFLDNVPNATSYIQRNNDDTLSFIRRPKTKEEAEAAEVPANARSSRALEGAQTGYYDASTQKTLKGDLPYLQAQTKTEIFRPEHIQAETRRLNQDTVESQARVKKTDAETRALTIQEPWIIPGIKADIGRKNAEAFNAVQQGGYYSRMPNTGSEIALESLKAYRDEAKDVIKGHEMQKKQIDNDIYTRWGGNPTLAQRAEGLSRHTQDALGVIYKLGSNNDYARGEAAEVVDSLYGGWVEALSTKLPTVWGRQGWGYTEARNKVSAQMRALASQGNQLYDVLGPYMPKDALQKVTYMDYIARVREGSLKPVGWKSPSDIPDSVLMANLIKKFSITDQNTIQGIYQSWVNIKAQPVDATERTRVSAGGVQ